MAYKILAALLLLSLITTNEALRILVCFPMTSKSHSILGHGVVDRLLEAGHEVVHITSFPKEEPVPNLRELNVSSIGDVFKKEAEKSDAFKLKNMIGKGNFGDTFMFAYFSYIMHKEFIREPSVVKLLSDPKEKFDAVILEWFFSESHVGIPALFEAPLIWVCSTEPHWQVLRLINEVPNPAYIVDLFSTRKAPLNFWQRAEQLWRTAKKYILINLIVTPLENWLYNSAFPEIAAKRGVEMPSFSDAMYNGSLMFVNSHPSIGGAMPLPQNAINVAGYHIQDKVKPLPKNLQTLMDGAKHGVIYFSLGSNMLSDGMSEEMKRSLLNLFSKLDQTVIWKFESDLDKVPANVHLVKWAPQPSILAHPNLKLFITHGGQLSTTEAIHYGVPVVGLPIMADQYINMVSIESKGFGIGVTLAEGMADELEAAVKKVLSNESYKAKAKELSAIYHNRTMKPGDAISYWVEQVVRTHGAPHLRSPALTVSFYQRLLIVTPLENWLYNSAFPEIAAKRGVEMPSFSDAMYNGSLMFVNSHPSIGGAMPLPQNAINVAGYHIQDKVKPLPKNLQTLMDGAKHGVIYFSLGSNMLSDGMSEEMKRSLLNLFSKLDQTVIWKFESDLDKVPANVHLVKWAPQPSILAHPNLKLFITHGGQLSTTEAIHYGVPVVGLPIMADQYINMESIESKGFGIGVTLAEGMADELEVAVKKVLSNESYKAKAKELSAIYHNRTMKPGDAISYWVEQVVRTHGAPHLRSPALTVSFYQRLYLDLLALIVIVIVIICKLVKYVLKMRSKKPTTKSKKE